jgi:hypothetical protein
MYALAELHSSIRAVGTVKFPVDATIERFRTLAVHRFECQLGYMARQTDRYQTALRYATGLVREVCKLAGEARLIEDSRAQFAASGIFYAVRDHDNAALFEWLMEALSYQGVSDAIASGYMEEHGKADFKAVANGLTRTGLCPKLNSYWQFDDCGYRKTAQTCSEPTLLNRCPVPCHRLRNGRLNQTAYSLFLFCRDVAQGDLVDWLDRRLVEADGPPARDRGARLADAVVKSLTHISNGRRGDDCHRYAGP